MKRIIVLFTFFSLMFAQGTWMVSGRTHPELHWSTLSSDHFNIHYHQGLEGIAKKGLSIAEQCEPILMKQLDLKSMPKVDITFTAEDEIMNGFALWTNTIFIWVDQNDAALWLEDQKWLYQVVAHELQHVVFFNAQRSSWLPDPWNYLFSGTPGWFVEGLAEYMTEHWRPYRADLSHKVHFLKDEAANMDPHHDGYSKLLYLADRFGDSTIVKIIHYRTNLKTADFKKAFKKFTGISVSQFNEDWRRQMNTYYYGYRAQKEAIEEVGKTVPFPVKEQNSFKMAPDSNRIAIISKRSSDQFDQSLMIATRDTSKPKPGFFSKIKKKAKDKKEKKPKKKKVRWKTKEVDYGRFHTTMSWSPDGEKLAYAKYHYGKDQSLVWDIREADFSGKKPKFRWLTTSGRALHPAWSPDGSTLVYVEHRLSVSNLMTMNVESGDEQKLTNFTKDTQIMDPRWSPDGQRIAMALAGPDGKLDIAVLNIASGAIQKVTAHEEADYQPVWNLDGSHITYTSHFGADSLNSAPNLFTVDLSTGNSIRNTDVGDAIWSLQRTPKDSTILATTLPDLDSVRVVEVDPNRAAHTERLSLRTHYTEWQTHHPTTLLTGIDPSKPIEPVTNGRYKPFRNLHPMMYLALPYLDGRGVFGATVFADAMYRHIFELMGGVPWAGPGKPWALLSYVNGAGRFPWGLNYFWNSRWDFRYYDQSVSGLLEQIDGLELFAAWPLNFGQSLSSNHSVIFRLGLTNRRPDALSDSLDTTTGNYIPRNPGYSKDLPIPEAGREGKLTLGYRWLNRRPNRQNSILPNQGYGLEARSIFASKAIYGDFSYTRLEFDSFVNLPVGKGPAFYFRLKGQAMNGRPAAQDSLGLTRDPNIYLPTGILDAGIFAFVESNNPRGWNGVRLGNRLVFGTAEFRIPLIPQLPVNILGLTLGSLTGALITDFGNAWNSGQSQASWIVTTGYEVKIGIQAGKSPLVFVAVGKAQTQEDWRAKIKPEPYARLVLINPF